MGFALREDGQEGVRRFEGGRTKVETVEVGKVGLVAGGRREGPVAEEETKGVGGCACGAEGGGVPGVESASVRGRRAGNGAVVGERVGERMVFEGALMGFCFAQGAPRRRAIQTPFNGNLFRGSLGIRSKVSEPLQRFPGYRYSRFIVNVEGKIHVWQPLHEALHHCQNTLKHPSMCWNYIRTDFCLA